MKKDKIFIKKDAGDVEKGIETFNNSTMTESASNITIDLKKVASLMVEYKDLMERLK